jgi:hypothetical protein
LNQQREDDVGKELTQRRYQRGTALSERVSRVSNVLEPESVDDLGQDKQRNDPDEGEDERNRRVNEAPEKRRKKS